MTDNRTTERLMAMLEERGVEYKTHGIIGGKAVTWHGSVCNWIALPDERGLAVAVYKDYLTPEQAIAATLGSVSATVDDVLSLLDEMNEQGRIEYADYSQLHDAIAATLGDEINGETSDGYHTFNELYHHRAVLFSVVVAANSSRAWKSKSHHDGTMYDGMFIVGVDTPQGQATYHYDVEPYWDMFWCKELERAPEWDGHTPEQAIERIGSLRDVVFKGPKGRR